jgi:Domain of unknown function (DUF6795)
MGRPRWWWLACGVALALAGPGCAGRGKVKVSGVVTLDGRPVEGAMVTFVPTGKETTHVAHATTDKDGQFSLSTSQPGDGAYPGEYKVTVVYAEGAVPPAAEGMKAAFEGFEKAQKKKRKKPPKYDIPARYSDPATTDLTQRVPAGGQVQLALKGGS